MSEKHQRRCKQCSKVLEYSGLGKPPSYCLEHRRNRARDKRHVEAQLRAAIVTTKDLEAKQRLGELTEDKDATKQRVPSIWYPRILAIARGLESDPRQAAELVGLELDGEALVTAGAASDRHQDLTDAKPAAVGRLVLTAIALSAIRLAAQWEQIPIAQLPAAQRSLAQSLELIQGSTTPAYSEIKLVIEHPGEG